MYFTEQDRFQCFIHFLIEIDAQVYVQLFLVNIHMCLLCDLWLDDCTVSLQLFPYSEEECLLSFTGQQASLVFVLLFFVLKLFEFHVFEVFICVSLNIL